MPENPVYTRDDGHFIYLATVELGVIVLIQNTEVNPFPTSFTNQFIRFVGIWTALGWKGVQHFQIFPKHGKVSMSKETSVCSIWRCLHFFVNPFIDFADTAMTRLNSAHEAVSVCLHLNVPFESALLLATLNHYFF